MKSFRLTLALAVFLLLPTLSRSQNWHDMPGGRWTDLPPRATSKPGFQILDPQKTGVQFTNTLTEAEGAANRTLYNGSGVAAGDVDGDGRPDIVFAGVEGQLTLFKNLGNWQFTNITAQSGLSASNITCRGLVLADITGDGALDLLLSGNGSGVRCWRNDGHGHFADMTARSGTATKHGSVTMTLADVDGNGTLDLYVANNRTDDIRDKGQVQLRLVKGKPVVPPALTNRFVLTNGQVLEYGEPDILYLNDGSGHFHQVSWTDGSFLDEDSKPLSSPPLDWGLTAKRTSMATVRPTSTSATTTGHLTGYGLRMARAVSKPLRPWRSGTSAAAPCASIPPT
jgi:hypothetical protein